MSRPLCNSKIHYRVHKAGHRLLFAQILIQSTLSSGVATPGVVLYRRLSKRPDARTYTRSFRRPRTATGKHRMESHLR